MTPSYDPRFTLPLKTSSAALLLGYDATKFGTVPIPPQAQARHSLRRAGTLENAPFDAFLSRPHPRHESLKTFAKLLWKLPHTKNNCPSPIPATSPPQPTENWYAGKDTIRRFIIPAPIRRFIIPAPSQVQVAPNLRTPTLENAPFNASLQAVGSA